MAAVASSPLPRWDLSSAFPALDSKEFKDAFESIKRGIAAFAEELALGEALGSETTSELIKTFESLLGMYNDLQRQVRTVGSYVHGFVAVDSRNEEAQALDSELEIALIPLSKLGTRFTAWMGSLSIEELIARSQGAREHAYALEKASVSARHLMSPEEEALAADLHATSASSWSRLHNNVTSQIEVHVGGRPAPLAMSMVRNLAYDPDRNVRREAFIAELEAWKANEVPLAAALNGVKGTALTLTSRRGWGDPLDEALFNTNIDRETLEAMLMAARESFPDFRRYLNAKAKALGIAKLAFFDIFAPVGEGAKSWDYKDGADFVAQQFYQYSEKMGAFAERSHRENWIDAESRPGKSDGAFCMWLVADESRVLMNYKTSFGSVKTLAHELGHAYHNLCLAERTMTQRRTPMTLAETASIFCETIVKNAALKQVDKREQLSILEGSLQSSCQTTVDITSRFLFEQAVFEARKKRELSANEFCQLMLDAQRQTYGDALDEEFLHPYMWAVKSHYYSQRSYYNFPYMFGMLFSLGLYSRYEKDPESFKESYDELLSSTGLADAATLASRFGIDIRTPSFWRSSFDVLRDEITLFEQTIA